jgi:hypothetical protein
MRTIDQNHGPNKRPKFKSLVIGAFPNRSGSAGSDLRADNFPDNMISNLKNVRNSSFSIGEKAGLRESKNTSQFPNHGIAELSRMVWLSQAASNLRGSANRSASGGGKYFFPRTKPNFARHY